MSCNFIEPRPESRALCSSAVSNHPILYNMTTSY